MLALLKSFMRFFFGLSEIQYDRGPEALSPQAHENIDTSDYQAGAADHSSWSSTSPAP
jgi:hypothetical protein